MAGKSILFFVVLVTPLLPIPVRIVALFDIMSKLKWIDTYWGLIVPFLASTIGALTVIEFIYIWNQYLWALMATNSKHMRVVQIGVKMLISSETMNNWGVIMAGVVMTMIPPLLVDEAELGAVETRIAAGKSHE